MERGKLSVLGFMGFLKGKSSQVIYERWGNIRYQYRGYKSQDNLTNLLQLSVLSFFRI